MAKPFLALLISFSSSIAVIQLIISSPLCPPTKRSRPEQVIRQIAFVMLTWVLMLLPCLELHLRVRPRLAGSPPSGAAPDLLGSAPPGTVLSTTFFSGEKFNKFAESTSSVLKVRDVLDKSFGVALRDHLASALKETLLSVVVPMLQ